MTLAVPVTRLLSRFVRLLPVLLALTGLPAGAAAQTTKVLSAPGSELTDDTTIRGGGYSDVNYSTDTTLSTKTSGDVSNVRRVLLKFDTSNTIPAGASVSKAVLTLTLQSAGAASSRPIAVRRVTKSFLKASANWSNYRSSTYWAAAGGDLAETWATTNVGRTAGSAVSFDVTSLVQKTVSGTFDSRYTRVALVDVGGADNESLRSFHSSRAATSSVRPKLVVTYGGSATALPLTTSTTSGTTLKVMSYNTHHGVGSDGRYDLNRIADVIVNQNVDVVALQEVMFNSGFGNGENQPETYKRLVQQKTGRTWYYVYARMDGNWGSTSWAVGNMLLSRLPFSTTSRYALSYERSVAHGKVFVGGRGVNLFSTHLDAGSSSSRATQINQLKYYASTFGESRVVLGDFNARPGSSEYSLMVGNYQDAWADGVAAGVASSPSGSLGYTMGTSRIDFIFESRGASTLALARVAVISSSASDHRALVATYRIQ
jgi:endonuclease/exonuclease/phosphatase family metal-dependent hydrolase